jgi:hypothetical protein
MIEIALSPQCNAACLSRSPFTSVESARSMAPRQLLNINGNTRNLIAMRAADAPIVRLIHHTAATH